jgi:hypothetical protein
MVPFDSTTGTEGGQVYNNQRCLFIGSVVQNADHHNLQDESFHHREIRRGHRVISLQRDSINEFDDDDDDDDESSSCSPPQLDLPFKRGLECGPTPKRCGPPPICGGTSSRQDIPQLDHPFKRELECGLTPRRRRPPPICGGTSSRTWPDHCPSGGVWCRSRTRQETDDEDEQKAEDEVQADLGEGPMVPSGVSLGRLVAGPLGSTGFPWVRLGWCVWGFPWARFRGSVGSVLSRAPFTPRSVSELPYDRSASVHCGRGGVSVIMSHLAFSTSHRSVSARAAIHHSVAGHRRRCIR